jgi:hypothetical protein
MNKYWRFHMGVRRASDGSYCLKLSRQFSSVPYAMLLLCLLVMGVCSCSLSEPQKEQKPAEAPAKMPLPQRGGQAPTSKIPVSSVDKKEAVPAAGVPTKSAQVAVPTAAPVTKPASKKAELPPANGKKALPLHSDIKDKKTTVAAKAELKSAQQVNKAQPAITEKKGVLVAEKAKTAAVTKKQDEKEKTPILSARKKTHLVAAGVPSRNWTVVAGPYLLEETLANDLAKIGKAGLTATVQPGSRRKTAMRRLFLAQFDDRAAAQGELDKLKKLTSDAFILDHGGKHVVYAGSYLLDSRAESEKERLAAAGFALTIKRADVAIPSKRLIIGTYRDKSVADAAAKRLKNAGLKDVRVHP